MSRFTDEIEEDGWDAAMGGAGPFDNPYTEDSRDYHKWKKGWDDYKTWRRNYESELRRDEQPPF